MPSRKKVAQRASATARMCNSKVAIVVGSPHSSHLDDQEKPPTQQQPSKTANESGDVPTGCQMLVRNSSQKSISTDEGSSSSGYSSRSPAGSEGSVNVPPDAKLSPCTAAAQEHHQPLPVQVSIPGGPIWVGNGQKGDDAAWLLVMPKFPQPGSGDAKYKALAVPKSPKDAVLLGPYVISKNTFLDESRVGESRRFPNRLRSQSLGALP